MALLAEFAFLKAAPQSDKDCVFGFIREAQDLVPYTIPQLVVYKCLAFYYRREMWDQRTQNMMLDETGYKVWNSSSNRQMETYRTQFGYGYYHGGRRGRRDTNKKIKFGSVYGTITIDFDIPCIYEWEVEIQDLADTIIIGVVESQQTRDLFIRKCANYCAYWDDGKITAGGQKKRALNVADGYGEDSIVKVEVNTVLKIIKFYTNGEDHGVVVFESGGAPLNTSVGYTLAVALGGSGAQVEIVGFSQKMIEKLK